MPATSLKVLNLGQQTTFPTAVAATARLMGLTDVKLKINDNIEQSPSLGTVGPGPLVAQVSQDISGSASQDVTYEDVMYPLHGILGSPTPTGTTAPYTWIYAAPLTAVPAPKIYTGEAFVTGYAYNIAGMLINKLTIKGEAGSYWKADWDYLGKGSVATTLTALSDRVVQLVRMADTVLAMDTWAGTMAATPVPAALIDFSLELDTKRHTKIFAGALGPGDWGDGKWEGKLKITLEVAAAAKAYVDALLAGGVVQRQISIKASTGSAATAVESQIQFCGTLEDGIELYSDRDGNMTVELSWLGTYNTTFGNWMKYQVKNGAAALV